MSMTTIESSKHRFEGEIQVIIDRAYETEKVYELVRALQKALAE